MIWGGFVTVRAGAPHYQRFDWRINLTELTLTPVGMAATPQRDLSLMEKTMEATVFTDDEIGPSVIPPESVYVMDFYSSGKGMAKSGFRD